MRAKRTILLILSLTGLIALCSLIVFLEFNCMAARAALDRGNYCRAAAHLEKIGGYRGGSKILASDEMRFFHAYQSMDCSDIEGADIAIPDLAGLNACRVCLVLKKLGIDYRIEYVDEPDSGCNEIVSYELDGDAYLLRVNDFYGSSYTGSNFVHGSLNEVAERGEYIFFSYQNELYRCRADLSDLKMIHSETQNIQEVQAKGNDLYYSCNNKLYKINNKGGNKTLVLPGSYHYFLIHGNNFYVLESQQNKFWLYNTQNGNFIMLRSDGWINLVCYNGDIGYFNDWGGMNEFINFSNDTTEKFDDWDGKLFYLDYEENIIATYNEQENFIYGVVLRRIKKDENIPDLVINRVRGFSCNNDILYITREVNRGFTKNELLTTINLESGRISNYKAPHMFGGIINKVGGYIFTHYCQGISRYCFNPYTEEFIDIGVGFTE